MIAQLPYVTSMQDAERVLRNAIAAKKYHCSQCDGLYDAPDLFHTRLDDAANFVEYLRALCPTCLRPVVRAITRLRMIDERYFADPDHAGRSDCRSDDRGATRRGAVVSGLRVSDLPRPIAYRGRRVPADDARRSSADQWRPLGVAWPRVSVGWIIVTMLRLDRLAAWIGVRK